VVDVGAEDSREVLGGGGWLAGGVVLVDVAVELHRRF
jgi:hypothetical protein